MKNSETFCILPWMSAVIGPDGDHLICCRSNPTKTEVTTDTVNTTVHKHLRNTLGQGIKDPICTRCWTDEKYGIESYRQSYNKRYSELIASDSYDPPKLRFLELTPSNVCNLACRMCNSRFSSKVLAREKHLVDLGLYENPDHLDALKGNTEPQKPNFINWRDLDLSCLEELKLMGGEPMYLREHIEILEHLDSINVLEKMHLMVITNCTHDITSKWEYLISKAKTAHIAISIDGVGDINEYIRQYSKWEVVEDVLDQIQDFKKRYENKISLTVNITVGIYNINKTKEIEDYMKNRNLHYYFNNILHPSWQSLSRLDEKVKNYFLNHSGVSEGIKHVLKEPSSEDITTSEEFISQTSAADNFYGKFLKDYNFEIYDLYYNNKISDL